MWECQNFADVIVSQCYHFRY